MRQIVNWGLIVVIAAIILVFSAQAVGDASRLSKQEVKALITNAKTRPEHLKLAAYYHDEADRLRAEQREHQEELAVYSRSSQYASKYPSVADHCRELAGFYGLAAEKAEDMAKLHESLADK